MTRWWIAVAVAALALGTVMLARSAGPGTLSLLDGLMGGGRGTMRVGSGVPFGGHGLELDVWRPSRATRGAAQRPLPVVVFWYGGGWVHGTRGDYAFAARALARAGFLVVVPDYRKVPGVRFPAFVEDGAEAVRWVRDHAAEYGGDPASVALTGHSAGAYIAAMLALDRHWLAAAGVDPAIVAAAAPMCGPYDFYPFTGRAVAAFAGVRDLAATQPVGFARADAPPMLLISAGADSQVRARNALNLAARLRAVGAPVEHRDYPGLSHESVVMALSVPFRGRAPVLADTVAFLRAAFARRPTGPVRAAAASTARPA